MNKLFVLIMAVILLLLFWHPPPAVNDTRPWRAETQLTRFWSTVSSEGQIASWYGKFHHGRRMANGRIYNMYNISVAHRTLPLGTFVKVTNLANGKSVYAKVTDRGPYVKGRVVDMSYGAALQLNMVKRGIVPCRVEVMHVLRI